MKRNPLGRQLSAAGLMVSVACATIGATRPHEEIGPYVRVHRIYPGPAEAEAASASAAPEADAPQKLEDVPKLSVRGNANLDKPADRLLLNIGVVTQMESPTSALEENSRKMDQVVKAIRKVGLGEGDYQTGQFELQPVYQQRTMPTQADWEPRIIAYRVTNNVHVKTKKLNLAGQLIQAANEAGANQIGSIGFDLADPRVHRAEAIRVATANAIADARTLAEASGVNLVRIVTIDLDPFTYQPVFGGQMMRAAAAESMAPPVTPGDVTVTAGVTIVYEIRQRE